MARLGLAQLAGEGELAVVIHRLIGKVDERIPVDRCVDLPNEVRRERLAKIDAADAGAELGMELFVSELVHGFSTCPAVRS